MLTKRKWILLAALIGLILVAAGCSGDKNATETEGDPVLQDVDLVLYSGDSYPANDEDFYREFGQYIERKYPHMKFQSNIYSAQSNQQLEAMLLSGTQFDMIKRSPVLIHEYVESQISSDISELVKKHNFDLSAIDPNVLQLITNAAGGQLIGLPYQTNSLIVFYNKQIFDNFAVPYPEDDMTWTEFTELVRRVTRVDNGISYSGFQSQQGWGNVLRGNQLSVDTIDSSTNRAVLATDQWRQILNVFVPMFRIEGNELRNAARGFLEEQSIAMLLAYPNFYEQIPDTMNWDMIAAPSLESLPGVGFQPIPSMLVIADGPNRDAAFLAIAEITSYEVQLDRARSLALASVLTDPRIRNEIGAGIPKLAGKNTSVMQPVMTAAPITFGLYTSIGSGRVGAAFTDAANGLKDINTALREREEEANKLIAEREGG